MQCPKCGSTAPDGSSVCPACGAALTSSDPGGGMFKRPGNIGSSGFALSEESVSPAYKSSAPTLFCAHCGAALPTGSKVCPACGAPTPLSSTDATTRLSDSGIHISMGGKKSTVPASPAVPPVSRPVTPPAPPAAQPVSRPVTPPAGGYVPPAPPSVTPPAPPATPYGGYAAAADTDRSASSFLRRVCGSPLFLIVAIVFSVTAVFNAITNSQTLFPLLGDLDKASGEEGFQAFVLVMFMMLEGIVLPLLWTLGMWLLFVSSQSRGTGGMSTGGLTTFKATETIALIVESLTLGYILVQYIITLGDLEKNGYMKYLPGEAKAQLFLILGFLLVAWVFLALYRAFAIRMVSSTASAVRLNTTAPCPLTSVAVCNIIMAVGLLIIPILTSSSNTDILYSNVFLLVFAIIYESMDTMGKILYFVSIAVRVLFAVQIIMARDLWSKEARR